MHFYLMSIGTSLVVCFRTPDPAMNVVEPERLRPGLRVSPIETDAGFEGLISETSARLIAAPFDGLDRAIEVSLDAVRTFFRAERCGLLRVHEALQVVNVASAAYAEGVTRVSGDIDLAESFPWCRQKLLVDREPVVVSRMVDLPPEAATRTGKRPLSTRRPPALASLEITRGWAQLHPTAAGRSRGRRMMWYHALSSTPGSDRCGVSDGAGVGSTHAVALFLEAILH